MGIDGRKRQFGTEHDARRAERAVEGAERSLSSGPGGGGSPAVRVGLVMRDDGLVGSVRVCTVELLGGIDLEPTGEVVVGVAYLGDSIAAGSRVCVQASEGSAERSLVVSTVSSSTGASSVVHWEFDAEGDG